MKHYRYNIRSGVKKVTNKATKLSLGSFSLGLASLAVLLAVPVLTLAAKPPKQVVSTEVVTKEKLADNFSEALTEPDWFFYNDESDTIDNSLGSMVNGPATPPQGDGSVQISVSGTQRRNIATYQFAGTKLADLTELKYSTYNPSAGNGGSPNRSGFLNFNIDFNGTDTWQRRLVFLPSDNGTIQQNQWQTWDAVNGGNALYRYSGPTTWPGSAISSDTPRTLSNLIASYPDIRIRVTDSWLGIRVGEPYDDGYTENIDNFVSGTATQLTTFDFELVNQPAKNPDCGKDGWQNFNAPAFGSETECKHWVHGLVSGHLWLENPSQEVEFNANNVPDQATVHNAKKGVVRYRNYDYPGGVLDYTTDIICANANPDTEVGRFMYQIPEGHPGLSGLYVILQVSKGRKGTSNYAQAVTTNAETALAWCQGRQSFSATPYEATSGWVKVQN